jgi:hypothetical protein
MFAPEKYEKMKVDKRDDIYIHRDPKSQYGTA